MPWTALAPISSRATPTPPVPDPISRTVGRTRGASRTRSSRPADTPLMAGKVAESSQSDHSRSKRRATRGSASQQPLLRSLGDLSIRSPSASTGRGVARRLRHGPVGSRTVRRRETQRARLGSSRQLLRWLSLREDTPAGKPGGKALGWCHDGQAQGSRAGSGPTPPAAGGHVSFRGRPLRSERSRCRLVRGRHDLHKRVRAGAHPWTVSHPQGGGICAVGSAAGQRCPEAGRAEEPSGSAMVPGRPCRQSDRRSRSRRAGSTSCRSRVHHRCAA